MQLLPKDIECMIIGMFGGVFSLAMLSSIGGALIVTALMSFASYVGKWAGAQVIIKYKEYKSKKVKK